MKYDKYLAPDGSVCAKPASNGGYTLQHFIHQASEATSLTGADIKAVCAELAHFLATALARGCTVQLPEIGTFGISLTMPQEDGERELTGRDVSLKRVTFKASALLKGTINEHISCIERVEASRRQERRRALPLDERRAKALALADAGEFAVSKYRSATHTSAAQASRDLAKFVGEGLLAVRHLGCMCFYSAAAEE